MKIKASPSPIPLKVNKVPPRPSQPLASDQVRSKRQGDTVTLSKTAAAVAEATRRVKAMPDADMTKVARVIDRLKDGTYQTDADKAAANILAESLLKD